MTVAEGLRMAPVVLITGSSTGVGAACAARLAAGGWTVLAGVRRAEDGDALVGRVAGDVRPVRLDVTDEAAIDRAKETVREVCGGRGLRGLVNNAGVPLSGPFELVSMEQWREHLEVNLLGAVSVTRAMFDHVRAASGRFVFVGSQSGRIALPCTSTYSAGKQGLEAITEALHHELAPTSMRVALIEPGQVNTPLFRKAADDVTRLADQLEHVDRAEYRHLVPAARAYIRGGQKLGMNPERVARQVEHALSAARPRRRYLVGFDARLLGSVVARLPDPLRDRIVAAILRSYVWAGRRMAPPSATPTSTGDHR
jgi:NAD(P)-dependent dehydrogenase (short-subunit alcohol dehydrogenase family)